MAGVVAIVGATASGKSDLALALAERLNAEIVSADALQAYRGFDIGTAKPTAEQRRRVPHHLIDILEPHERYSAGEFARRARRAIARIRARGRVALVVGGSGLYLRALLEGIREIPAIDDGRRRELRRMLREDGLPALRSRLAEIDPETAEGLGEGDAQRTLRALEVALQTGKPLSVWLAEKPFGVDALEAVRVGLTLPRAILYDRISERARRMLDAGWVEEVRDLLGQRLSPSLPAFQAIGYRQIADYLQGRWPLERAIEVTVAATRRFAKRQATWFRKEGGVEWFSGVDPASSREEVETYLISRGIEAGDGQAEH